MPESVAFRFDAKNPQAQRVAERIAANMVTNVGDKTIQAIRALIVRSIREGIPVYDAARMIREMVGMTAPQAQAAMTYRETLINSGLSIQRVDTLMERYVKRKIRERAKTIARTETITALNRGQQESWRQAKRDGFLDDKAMKEVIVTPDEKLCPICSGLDGQAVPIDEPFQTARGEFMSPAFHPRCFPGDVQVLPCGPILAQTERWYDGNLLVINTASGKKLPVTPNHPILTPHGWISAGGLNVGSYVIGGRFHERPSSGVYVDDQYIPASFHDIAKSLRCSEQVASAPVPVSPEDFHGDGKGSDIAVIRTNGLLRNDSDPACYEQIRQFFLRRAYVSLVLLYALRYFASFGNSRLSPPGRSMGSGNLGGAFFGGHTCPFQSLGFASTTWFDTIFDESCPNGVPTNSEMLGDLILRMARNIKPHDIFFGHFTSARSRQPHFGAVFSQYSVDDDIRNSEFERELLSGCAGEIAADKILFVERRDFSGHVYNLQTTTGVYWANGILTHNCRCAMALVSQNHKKR